MIEVVLREVLGPGGETEDERVTVPLNPFRLVKVMSDVPVEPCGMLRELGEADIVKSETTTRMVTECVSEPVVPVTVTV